MPKTNFSWLAKNESLAIYSNGETSKIASVMKKKKKLRALPPVCISEMNRLLVRNRAAYHAMRPRWSSPHDKKILAMKAEIENAPIVKNAGELYAPAFRNISMFKRSYELMEKTLKIYVYKEGQKPIFHQPLLKGLYASEGWFMKLMEGNKQFVVSDPRKANMFYIPFSSRLLQFALYVRNSHNRTNLKNYLQDHVNTIAAKYPFWNRTGGGDHFIVACHDWAPYETRHAMARAIRALCVADLHFGFRLGKDVSLPETYVRSARNTLKDIGGKPANERTILAFYAGSMHGTLRPILLQHWENKDKDMKIFGPLPSSIKRNMNYRQFMKSTKYCICPRGYEVNSPRVIESIFYACVPVIISDNYVPPFFEVFNWEAFSVIIPEKDVPRLKEILLLISEEKYNALQLGVRKVQKHFLCHNKPVKYDLFHMILHSISYNKVYQIRTR
ncbi:probable glycosyltransferase At5g03795 [Dioscorea cayenensis subsp. rotundata]|uniref:Probable glycosyltransferase At5g03795 n=1 Tax=Dioscorea cayennensis subsp. rotundata TaxID=55577 RepID=A0AB40AR23_DIOCR|nr:probable glycosyltransferase At5g03795 [Dioscorea cayenensis subsp. rotundata]